MNVNLPKNQTAEEKWQTKTHWSRHSCPCTVLMVQDIICLNCRRNQIFSNYQIRRNESPAISDYGWWYLQNRMVISVSFFHPCFDYVPSYFVIFGNFLAYFIEKRLLILKGRTVTYSFSHPFHYSLWLIVSCCYNKSINNKN